MTRTHTSLALATLAALGLAAAMPQSARAQTPGLTIVTPGFSRSASTPNPQFGDFANGTVGFLFTVGPQDVSVVDLGYYVGNADGSLAESHQVGIFTTGGALVGTTATLGPGGAGAYAPDAFAYAPVVPFTLAANTPYLIGGYTGADNTDPFLDPPTLDGGDIATPGSGIASIDGPMYGDPGFTAPTSQGLPAGSRAYLGPDFELAAAPEPSQFAGLALGALGLAGLGWKARRRTA